MKITPPCWTGSIRKRSSIEKLYFGNNVTTGIDVAQARGLILLGAAQRNIPVFEYSPVQIKQAVVGYGNAGKAPGDLYDN